MCLARVCNDRGRVDAGAGAAGPGQSRLRQDVFGLPRRARRRQARTDAMLEQPDPNDWVNWRRTQDAWGYSPLNQINKQNASQLQLVWATSMMPGRSEATPLVYKGVMYLPNPNGGLQALDAATGELLWSYKKDIESQDPPRMPTYSWDDFAGMRNLAIF